MVPHLSFVTHESIGSSSPSGEAMGVNRIKYSDCVIFMEVAGLGRGDECAATRKITEFSEERNVEQIDARSVGEPSAVFQSRWWTCGFSLTNGFHEIRDGRTSVPAQGTITGLAIFDSTAYILITHFWTDSAAKRVLVTNDLLTNAQVFADPGPPNLSTL